MKSVNRSLENVIAKTIAGFCNTTGGRLVIGVADNGDVIGLEKDYSTLKHSNRDGFERAIIGIVKKKMGGDLSPLIHFSFREMDGKDVCMLSIEPAPRAVYLDESNVSVFYIRSGNSTRQLDVREAVNFQKTVGRPANDCIKIQVLGLIFENEHKRLGYLLTQVCMCFIQINSSEPQGQGN